MASRRVVFRIFFIGPPPASCCRPVQASPQQTVNRTKFAEIFRGTPLRAAATAELQFHFKEIEEILNAHLPPEARQFVNWWANQKSGKRAHAFAWMAAGWLIPKVDIKADRVTFKRRGSY